MNKLINIKNENGNQLVGARELHEFLESKQDFTTWIKSKIEKYDFLENVDFTLHKFMEGKVWKHDYVLKIEMAKEVSMVESNEKGKEARKYFIKCEKQLQINHKLPSSYKEALLQLVQAEEEKEVLVLGNKQKDQLIGELKPRADYTDNILKNTGLVTITQISKDYGMSAQEMNTLLHDLKIQFKQSEQWLLYVNHHDKGYTHSETISIVRSDGRKDIKMNTKWTQKGRLFLYNLLKDNEVLPVIENKEAV